MGKNKKIVLNNGDELKKVAEPSKIITKVSKKNKEKKVVGKHVVSAPSITKTTDQAASGNELVSKKKVNKQIKKKPATESQVEKVLAEAGDQELAKIAKKKAKKIAQKLKKKQQRAGKKEHVTDNATKAEIKENPKGKTKKSVQPEENPKQTQQNAKKLKKAKAAADKERRAPSDPAATVFVGNLPINTKRLQLLRLFKDYAPVSSVRIRTAGGNPIFKHIERKSAGSLNAYVVLSDSATAERAVALNGIDFKGNHLRVTLASEKAPCGNDPKRTVLVGNLKYCKI